MEPISAVLAAAESKPRQEARDELVGAFWRWVRPLFLEDEAKAVEQAPESPASVQVVEARVLERMGQDAVFFEELARWVEELRRAGVCGKNVVGGSLERVQRIHIGDREYRPDEVYVRKNIVEGDVRDVGEFRLGDG